MADLRVPALRQPERVEAAYGQAVAALVDTIAAMQAGIASLETAMNAEFAEHGDAKILSPAPGLGPVLGARVLAEIGDDRT